MKTLTRDEFIDLLATKPPSAELADGSDIELTVEQAMRWHDMFEDKNDPMFIIETNKSVFLGEKENGWEAYRKALRQIGGTQ
jgi:hypothetical protein